MDGEYEIKNIQNQLDAAGVDTNDGDQIIVLLDGQIGNIPSSSLDDYNINAQGFAVAYAIGPTVFLKRTGQTSAFSEFDDGWYQKGFTPSYTPYPASQVIVDNVTNLVWIDTEIGQM